MNNEETEDASRSTSDPNTKCEEGNLNEILQEINAWTEKENDLDEEIKSLRDALNREPVVTDKDIMEQLHQYNDMKDAAQVVLGSLARIEEAQEAHVPEISVLERAS